MSITNGSFSAPIVPDLAKELESQVGTIAAGAGVPMVFNNLQPQQGATIYNVSNNVIRGTVVLTAGTVAVGAAATRTFTVPAGGTYSFDLADEGTTDSATGAIGSIDSISIVPVTVPATAGVVEASVLAVAAAATAGYVVVNWASA
jgi:hypothetical protein